MIPIISRIFSNHNSMKLEINSTGKPGKSTDFWKLDSTLLTTVHGVAEGRTRLSNFTFTFHFHTLEKEMATQSSLWGHIESDTTEVT